MTERDLHASAESAPESSYDDMTDDEKRHDQLTRAPKSTEADAAPRIVTSKGAAGATRIDIADTAVVRPGKGNDGAGS